MINAAKLAAGLLLLGVMGTGCFCDPQDPPGFVYSCSGTPDCPPNQSCGLCTGGQLMGLMVCGPLPSNATVTCNWNMTVRALGDGSYDAVPTDVDQDGLCDFVLLPRAPAPPDPAYVIYGTATEAEPVALPPGALATARDCSY
jgi:hypothetical protein